MRQAFIGIDVGTSSARAGIFDEKGSLLASARHPITVWHEAGGIVEQSSSEIWGACAAAVRTAMEEAELAPSAVRGVGFDATCSLVVLDPTGGPLTVSGSGDERRNVIVWMDHRAVAEAREVNDTRDDVLRYVGGSISPEMEIPKLLWLKRHLPSTYRSAGHFFDLSDYLSFRATRSTARSMCTLACKWNYLAHEQRWSRNYLERVGLGELASDSYAKIGNEIVPPGTPLGAGLTESAASDFGLRQGTPVGASLIDAHAGGVGTIGGHDRAETAVDVCRRLAYIMGTSACIMATTSAPCFVPGVWGPYYSGMVPGFWLIEPEARNHPRIIRAPHAGHKARRRCRGHDAGRGPHDVSKTAAHIDRRFRPVVPTDRAHAAGVSVDQRCADGRSFAQTKIARSRFRQAGAQWGAGWNDLVSDFR